MTVFKTKKHCVILEKDLLKHIEKLTKINRSEKNKILKELNSIFVGLKFEQKKKISDYRDNDNANIDDVEYMFGDIDNYYQPILTNSLFNKGYQRYHFRGDPNRNVCNYLFRQDNSVFKNVN